MEFGKLHTISACRPITLGSCCSYPKLRSAGFVTYNPCAYAKTHRLVLGSIIYTERIFRYCKLQPLQLHKSMTWARTACFSPICRVKFVLSGRAILHYSLHLLNGRRATRYLSPPLHTLRLSVTAHRSALQSWRWLIPLPFLGWTAPRIRKLLIPVYVSYSWHLSYSLNSNIFFHVFGRNHSARPLLLSFSRRLPERPVLCSYLQALTLAMSTGGMSPRWLESNGYPTLQDLKPLQQIPSQTWISEAQASVLPRDSDHDASVPSLYSRATSYTPGYVPPVLHPHNPYAVPVDSTAYASNIQARPCGISDPAAHHSTQPTAVGLDRFTPYAGSSPLWPQFASRGMTCSPHPSQFTDASKFTRDGLPPQLSPFSQEKSPFRQNYFMDVQFQHMKQFPASCQAPRYFSETEIAQLSQDHRINHSFSSTPPLLHSAATSTMGEPHTPFTPQMSQGSLTFTPYQESDNETTDSEDNTSQPYAHLIFRALKSAPNHRMVLQDIYRWFEQHTDKANTTSKGWQNSIRHNLSMNGVCFLG
jgi:hypothetical protein